MNIMPARSWRRCCGKPAAAKSSAPAPTPSKGIKAINRDRPDVLFLDIQMPVIDGFELLGMIDREIMPHVVFVTAYDEFALKAFEEKTLDYLLKPVEKAPAGKNLRQTAGPAAPGRIPGLCDPADYPHSLRQRQPGQADQPRGGGARPRRPERGACRPGRGECFTDLTLKVIEERTPLVRCHRQYLVNVDCIDEIRLLENGLGEIKSQGRPPPAGQPPLPEELKARLDL